MGRCELDDNRLKEFSICDEFEIGVNITDDEISEMAKELLDLRKENKTLQQTIDLQHETTISDLKLIGKLQQQNKELIKDAERLLKEAEYQMNCEFDADYQSYNKVEKLHNDIIQKYNIETT